MAKRSEVGDLERVLEIVEEAAPGLHDVEPPAPQLPNGLPPALIELYAQCDGMRLFIDAIEIVDARRVTTPMAGRWRFGEVDGDPVAIDSRGRIWRTDTSLDDDVCEGTQLGRWLHGLVEAMRLLYDDDGEFADVFDDDGEVKPDVRERQLKAQLKRDPAAPAPRWRLALALVDQGAIESARDQLEQVVADDPAFAWAWLDLARISEQLGDIGNAIDETRMAAETAEGTQHPQAGYFWSQLARLATRRADDVLRAQAATKVSLLDPSLKAAQLAGARESLEAGDIGSAKGLLELLRAVWPRDLEILDLARRIDGN
jgi:hypothetical protein